MTSSRKPGQRPSETVRFVLRKAAELLTTPPVLTVFAVINALVVSVAAFAYLAGTGTPLGKDGTEVVTGDYLAFLTGAEIVAQGDGARLYDLTFQKQVQQDLAGIELPSWQPYAYPPLLGISLVPLAHLPFEWGLRTFAIVSTLSAILGAIALARALPAIRLPVAATLTLVALTLGFFPLASTLPGRQTTAMTLALLCGALWACQTGRTLLAGILVGLLSYKPQFMLPVLALLAWRGQWRAVAAGVVTGLAHYLAGAAVAGPDWPLRFLAATSEIATLEMAQNTARHFSVMPFARSMLAEPMGTIAGTAILAVAAAGFLRRAPRVAPGDPDFPVLWALAVLAGMLASPYLQYYEFGLLVLPAAVGIEASLRAGRAPGMLVRLALAAVFVGYPFIVSADMHSRSQPLAVLLLAGFAWLCLTAGPRGGRSGA